MVVVVVAAAAFVCVCVCICVCVYMCAYVCARACCLCVVGRGWGGWVFVWVCAVLRLVSFTLPWTVRFFAAQHGPIHRSVHTLRMRLLRFYQEHWTGDIMINSLMGVCFPMTPLLIPHHSKSALKYSAPYPPPTQVGSRGTRLCS